MMPYVGGNVDQRLQELKQRQAARRGEVTAANRREEVKLSAFLNNLDSKHDKNMVSLNTKLHVTKIDLVREVKKTPSSSIRRLEGISKQVEDASKNETKSVKLRPKRMAFANSKPSYASTFSNSGSSGSKLYPFHLLQSIKSKQDQSLMEKRKTPTSPRQFPILAAKYYRQKQMQDAKTKLHESNKFESLTTIAQKCLLENPSQLENQLQTEKSTSTSSNSSLSLPSVSNTNAALDESSPPPNSPRHRRNPNGSYSRSKTFNTAVEASNDEILGLRNGKYFLRYSTSLESEKRNVISGDAGNIEMWSPEFRMSPSSPNSPDSSKTAESANSGKSSNTKKLPNSPKSSKSPISSNSAKAPESPGSAMLLKSNESQSSPNLSKPPKSRKSHKCIDSASPSKLPISPKSPKLPKSQNSATETTPRRKSVIDDALSLIEDVNRPT